MRIQPEPDRPNLSRLIEAARAHVMTDDELRTQRASWVRGEMAIGSDADEARYRDGAQGK